LVEQADNSVCFKFEFDSNEIDESFESEKHDEQRISTLRRITIDSMDDNENADDLIHFNLEFDLNKIDESD
jgi:hypothetical protein